MRPENTKYRHWRRAGHAKAIELEQSATSHLHGAGVPLLFELILSGMMNLLRRVARKKH